jgi:anti-sigma regulatory factor (Ser/Thr protein kinase)
MNSQSEGAVFAREFVKDFAKHVRFSDEDQKKINEM